jgi:hypothetical protein
MDSGVTLILTMVLLLGVSVVLVSLIGITADSILGSNNIQTQRSNDYALDGAVTTELQLARYEPVDCSSASRTFPAISPTISVECATTYRNSVRYVTIGACLSSTCTAAGAALVVSAHFTDGPRCGGTGLPTQTALCGESQIIDSWGYAGKG